MLKPGNVVTDPSTYQVVQQGDESCTILKDIWGVLYVTDSNNTLHYVGDNPISADAALLGLSLNAEVQA